MRFQGSSSVKSATTLVGVLLVLIAAFLAPLASAQTFDELQQLEGFPEGLLKRSMYLNDGDAATTFRGLRGLRGKRGPFMNIKGLRGKRAFFHSYDHSQ